MTPQCKCKPGSWLVKTIPPVCHKFEDDGTSDKLCEACEHEALCHFDPDPLLSIRKSRLERALEDAFNAGRDRGAFALGCWNGPYQPETVDAYITRALTELEQA